MNRLTTDKPEDNLMVTLNLFYCKDGETWVRGGGDAPDYPDVPLNSYIRRTIKAHNAAIYAETGEDLSFAMAEIVMDGPEEIEGLIATLYTTAWAFSALREKLKSYEDTGLEPERVASMKNKLTKIEDSVKRALERSKKDGD